MCNLKLILASGSPRRRQLLAEAGVAFELAEPYEVAETWSPELPAERVAEYLAGLKSDAFPRALAPDEVLLTADTTVILPAERLLTADTTVILPGETTATHGYGGDDCTTGLGGLGGAAGDGASGGLGGEILGKPATREEAIEMLTRLSGREHRVVTGVVLRGAKKSETFSVTTRVWFRELLPSEIEYYVDTFRPMDKAGAYGIQEWIGLVGVERIDGSYHNVMGLPVQAIYDRLNKLIKN